jgi:hypothetical protein
MQTSGGSQLHFSNITNRPTTLSGYGITDAFNGTWAGLTGKPTTIAGYGITDAFNGTWISLTGKPTTISGYGITDAMSNTSPANGITGANISNWNTAFSWGSHAGLYRPVSYVPGWSEITSNPFQFTSPANNQLIRYNTVSGRWENWSPNFLTSFTETDPLFALWDKSSGIIITSSQISDFQSSVANNPAVSANTAKNSYPAADAAKLAGIATGAEVNVNADWNAISGDAQIMNKPFLFSGNFNDLTNKPIIDGSETKIVAGTNISITGAGTTGDPYVVNSSGSDNNSGHFKIFYSNGSFIVPNGTTHIIVEAWGGGGGGAGGTLSTCGMGGNNYIGSNGTAGMYIKKVITVVPNESLNITIGSGGSAGCGGCNIVGCDYLGTNGTAGGSTSIGSYLTVTGGGGGSWGWGTSCTASVGANGETPGGGGKSGCGFKNGGNGGSGMMIVWY